MRPRTLGFLVAALIGAAIFVRLGVWQISRLHERQARNAVMGRRLAAAPVPLATLTGPPDSLRYRRVTLHGLASYNGEALLVQRTHDGSPGVFLLTPVRSGDSATLVVRGWVYAPDAMTIDRSHWREGDSLTVDGWLDEFPPARGPDTIPGRPEALRRIDRAMLTRHAGVPLRAMVLWATGPLPSSPNGPVPARFTLPELDDGPHRSYAIQWFTFAAIALVGAGLVIRNDRRTPQQNERDIAVPVSRF